MGEATQFVWRAAGCPDPVASDGTPLPPRGVLGRCAGCGSKAQYKLSDAISDNFTIITQQDRAWPFGGDAVCAACVWCCRTLALRAGLWFATERGIWWLATRSIPGVSSRPLDVLSALLEPPDPPFVAAYPRYGNEHGTESNCSRIVFGDYRPQDPLIRCQSKHVAIYARISHSRERYHLRVDDQDVHVDVPLWRQLRALVEPIAREMCGMGASPGAVREALTFLRLPQRTSLCVAKKFGEVRKQLLSYATSTWWELFVSLLPIGGTHEEA